MKRQAKIMLYIADHCGAYAPQDFAEKTEREYITGVAQSDLIVLLAGPDHEHYWDAWSRVLDSAKITDPTTGDVYTVYQDGDCWLVEDGAEFDDFIRTPWELGFFVDDGKESTGHAYSYEGGRQIYRDGEPFVYVTKARRAEIGPDGYACTPVEADEFGPLVVAALDAIRRIAVMVPDTETVDGMDEHASIDAVEQIRTIVAPVMHAMRKKS